MLPSDSLNLLSDLLIWSVSPGYSEIIFLLKRVLLFSLVFCILLKGHFQDGRVLLSLRPSSPHGNRQFCLPAPASSGSPYKGLDQLRYFQECMPGVKYSYSFPKLTVCNILLRCWVFSLLGPSTLSRIGHTVNLLFGGRKQSALCNMYSPWTYKCSFWLKICFLA